MDREYKAATYGGGSSGTRHKSRKSHTAKRTAEFNGVVTLTATEFARVEECLRTQGEPTRAAVRGAALLRKMYIKSR